MSGVGVSDGVRVGDRVASEGMSGVKVSQSGSQIGVRGSQSGVWSEPE
jgi:hypothetical protein